MNELKYKNDFCAYMLGLGFLTQSHEDKHVKFIPDLSFSGANTGGWIEVKYCDRVPGTLNDIEHWTRGQEDWLIRDGMIGTGNNYLLVGFPTHSTLWHWRDLRRARMAPLEVASAWAMYTGTAGGCADYITRTVGRNRVQRERRG